VTPDETLDENIHVDRTNVGASGVLVVELDRPHKRNAITYPMREGLERALQAASNDDAVRAIVLQAKGPCFSAGNDLAELGWLQTQDVPQLLERLKRRPDWYEIVWKCAKPVVSAVRSYCLGSATELALICDLTVCSEDALFGWPEIRGGGFPGTTWPYMLPMKKVREYLLTGRLIPASEALQTGMVNRVVPSADLEACALALAVNIAETACHQPDLAKQVLNQAYEHMGLGANVSYFRQSNVLIRQSPGTAAFWDDVEEHGVSAAKGLDSAPTPYWRYGEPKLD
jgi:enoyl-CoA hydratase